MGGERRLTPGNRVKAHGAPFSADTKRGVAWAGWFHYCPCVVCSGDMSAQLPQQQRG